MEESAFFFFFAQSPGKENKASAGLAAQKIWKFLVCGRMIRLGRQPRSTKVAEGAENCEA
jgi:hypothetical protein